MPNHSLDEVDREILFMLQEDARNFSNADISEAVGVSASTVGKRIKELENNGIIQGYYPLIDYDQAEIPLRVLFICTTSITDRATFIQDVLDLRGVVNVRELMTGERNVLIEVVGRKNEDITRLATAIDDLGIRINEEILVKNEYPRPASVFEM